MELFISPVIFTIGGFELRWYSLAYIIGFILAGFIAFYLNRFVKKEEVLTRKNIDSVLNFCIFGVLLGGRLGYVIFYEPIYFLHNPLEILAIWRGGMSFHGGLLGVIFAIYLFCKKYNISALNVYDRASVCVLPGLFLGRIANFINGELWGRPTDFWFGFIFPASGDKLIRHPSQLYEAIFEGAVPFCVFYILLHTTQLFKKRGVFSGMFLIFYGTARFFIEAFFREPSGIFDFGVFILSTGELLSLPMILLGIIIFKFSIKRAKQ
jgi:phosphatidylglycerol:prolipoprotein diacylglycerol transferase